MMKVLVVDDSVLYRRAIVKALQEVPGITEIFEASNGKEAVRKHAENPVDLITLDIEMPLMNGIEAIPYFLKANSKAYILMISSLTSKGAEKTLEALNAGASDFLTKEHAFGLSEGQKVDLVEEIKRKVQGVIRYRMSGLLMPKVDTAVKKELPVKRDMNRPLETSVVSLVLVGSSTGGPKALQFLLKAAQKKRNYAIVIVQHMPPVFTKQLADNLTRQTGHEVVEAEEGMVLHKDSIVIAPGGKHLILKKTGAKWTCLLNEGPTVNSCRPSVDVTFESVAEQMRQKEVVAIMLTGMGEDGAKGSLKLHEQKAIILTQDKNSCTVYGMPKAVDELDISVGSKPPFFLMAEAEKYMVTPRDLSRGN